MIATFTSHLPTLLGGAGTTLVVTGCAFVTGALLAVPLAALARSRRWPVRASARFLIDFIRSIPPIVWLFVIFYGLTEQGIRLEALPAAVLGLGIISGGYLAEVYKSGLLAVGSRQREAGEALGLSRWDVMRRVVAPQAFQTALPGMGTWLLVLLKESAAASIIGVSDIAARAAAEQQQTGDGLGTFAAAAAIYVALSLPVAVATRVTSKRVGTVSARHA